MFAFYISIECLLCIVCSFSQVGAINRRIKSHLDKEYSHVSDRDLFVDWRLHCSSPLSEDTNDHSLREELRTITGSAGMISVGDFDSLAPYPAGLNCSWLLEAPVGKVFRFYFLNLDLDANGQDKLEFFDESRDTNDKSANKMSLLRTFMRNKPSDTTSGLLRRFLGEQRPFLSSSNRVTIEFNGSQGPVSGSGFQFIYQHTNPIVKSCPIGTRRCRSRTACYNLAQTCDGELNCNDGTDEEQCPFMDERDQQFLRPCGRPSIEPLEGNLEEKISGGRASLAGSWPWTVSLRLVSKEPVGHMCGAVIINRQWLLSAAHCLSPEPNLRNWLAVFGQHEKLEQSSGYRVERYLTNAFIAPDYEDENIALGQYNLDNSTAIAASATSRDDIQSRLRENNDNDSIDFLKKIEIANEAARMNNYRSRGDLALIKLNAPLPTNNPMIEPICLAHSTNSNNGRTLFKHHQPSYTITNHLKQAHNDDDATDKLQLHTLDNSIGQNLAEFSLDYTADAPVFISSAPAISAHNNGPIMEGGGTQLNDNNYESGPTNQRQHQRPESCPYGCNASFSATTTTTTTNTKLATKQSDIHTYTKSTPPKSHQQQHNATNDRSIVAHDAHQLAGLMAHVVGWDSDYHGQLKQAQVPILMNDLCQKWYGHPFIITPSTLCAGYEQGRHDACKGDSGGPLMIKSDSEEWILVGIVSSGHLCAQPKRPGIYTRVTSYLSWLNSTMVKEGQFSLTERHLGNPTTGYDVKRENIFTKSTKSTIPQTGSFVMLMNKIREGQSRVLNSYGSREI